MKKHLLPFVLLTALSLAVRGQNPADEILRTKVWNIGRGSAPFVKDAPRLTFETTGPTVENASCRIGVEGTSTANSINGELLAYGIRDGVFDRFNDTIPSSQDIEINSSAVQAFLMLPKPDQNEFVGYTITTDGPVTSLQWKYSELNLSGSPSVGSANIELANDVLESMASVHHCNGKELWVVTHGIDNASFYFSLLDSLGNVNEPIIQSIGSVFRMVQGSIKFSADGKKLAICSGQEIFQGGERALLEVFHFDKETGILANPISLSTFDFVYSLCFSRDGRFLYTGTLNGELSQYSVEIWDSTAIENSRVLLAQNPVKPFGTMQNALDGKIYIAQGGSPQNDSLGIIHQPSVGGLGCNYQHSAFYLGGTFCEGGLPNFPESYFNIDEEAYPCRPSSILSPVSYRKELTIYPVPSIGNMTIEIPTELSPSDIASMEIFDALGRAIETSWFITLNSVKLECIEPRAGHYFGFLITNSQRYSFSFTINL
ncbi:MAG: SMP-30/gluconolactonase/LRE family protein [Flavobacteriales bacterium]|nr:SMP-30/gluconolactonase/LRE family protein [Flavobacteriales bacterium]